MHFRTTENERTTSVELARIVAMYGIVLCHFATHGSFVYYGSQLSLSRIWWNFIEMGGNLGTDVFVLISGFFMILDDSGQINIKRIIRFWSQILFYSLAIYLLMTGIGVSSFDLLEFVRAITPIISRQWGFASTYFVLYLIHPYLNTFLQSMNRIYYKKYIVIMLILFCVIPTLTAQSFESNSLIWFVTLYSVAAYIRLYGIMNESTAKDWLVIYLLAMLLRYISSLALILLSNKIAIALNYHLHFYETQSVLTFISALAFFMFFVKLKIRQCLVINVIASASFGVYLISDHDIIRVLLWEKIFNNARFQDSSLIIPYSIVVALLVYIFCSCIDMIRKLMVEKSIMKIVNYAEKSIKN